MADARESVVTITADGASTGGFLPFGHPTQGIGSGIILTADGYILTNRHVIEGARTLTVALHTGELVSARVIHASDSNDLALVKASRAHAAVMGRDFVTPDDVKGFARDALAHRLILKMEYAIDSDVTPARVLDEVLKAIETPKEFARRSSR